MKETKLDALAIVIGVSWQSVSKIEASETVDEEKLSTIAKVLGVSLKMIKDFSEEAVLKIIGNTLYDGSVINRHSYSCNFNPLDKVVELHNVRL